MACEPTPFLNPDFLKNDPISAIYALCFPHISHLITTFTPDERLETASIDTAPHLCIISYHIIVFKCMKFCYYYYFCLLRVKVGIQRGSGGAQGAEVNYAVSRISRN
jgi:hypothetical protein